MRGIAASAGVAVAPALLYLPEEPVVEAAALGSPEEELARFHAALADARASLQRVREHAAQAIGAEEAAVFDAQAMILDDPALIDNVERRIAAGASASASVQQAVEEIAATFAAMEDEYFAAREADVRDVGRRVLHALLEVSHTSLAELDEPVVVVARDLTPSDTATLRREMVRGFVTDAGGYTSHTAIIARTLGIPAVVGLGDVSRRVGPGDVLLVDGSHGEVTVNPAVEQVEAARRAAAVAGVPVLRGPARTRDGTLVEVAVNAGSVADVELGMRKGADGVGLFRTEFLYLGRSDLPGEDEQYDVYRRTLEALDGRPLVIRTLDAGGDKALPGLPPVQEPNPFLGRRGIRLCLQQPELLVPQLRAALRASAHGDVRLMFPMVAFVEELRQARRLLDDCRAELASAGVAMGPMQVGIMVETPAAALIAGRLAEEADFFSLGTNDLVQYTLAADRTNERVGALYQPLHPAVLSLVEAVARAAHARGRWVGVCGEMGSMPEAVPLLVGLGVTELSVTPGAVPAVKARVQALERAAAAKVARQALGCATPAEVQQLVSPPAT